MKKTFSMFLVILVILSCCSNAFAKDCDTVEPINSCKESDVEFNVENFANMTVDELNAVIDSIAMMSSERDDQSRDGALIAAWLAFAYILRFYNYPLTATLIEYSVNAMNYSEYDGVFSDAIRNETVYLTYINNLKNGQPAGNSLSFNTNDDLFYSLHNVSISNMQVLNTYFITITDVYDFAYDVNYDALITAFANNVGYLMQHKGALYPIYITIQFIDS